MDIRRRYSVGAEPQPGGGVHFRVWAPKRRAVRVRLEDGPGSRSFELVPEGDGFFSTWIEWAGPGTLYAFLLDDDEKGYPDPASRWQPQGPHGPSCVVDASAFRWTDQAWRGASLAGQVLYELHVGTFTREGTYAAAEAQLPELAALGITCIELMPVAAFPGRFSWGYDGVGLYAPAHVYGTPDDLRRFIDAAHRHDIAVILDVVYNHLGPSGNYLPLFSDAYVSRAARTEWGDALNFDGPGSAHVREFVLENAEYWIRDFHFDGLRLDATQQIYDTSDEHIVAAIARRVRESAEGRATIVVAENEPQDARLALPVSRGGYGVDGLWNDDFHHSAIVALTGFREAYYSDYRGRAQEFVSALTRGFLFQGQYSAWQKQRRGTIARDLSPYQFIVFLQNHDQVANSSRGDRIHQLSSPGLCRAFTGLLLLSPCTPLLFQGQEFHASSPFLYFADHEPPLAEAVRRGREEFLSQFSRLRDPVVRAGLADPADERTFQRSKLDFSERLTHAKVYAMHRDLIRLRQTDPVLRQAQLSRRVEGGVIGSRTFVLRYPSDDGMDLLLAVNLGEDRIVHPAPEPLLAPPPGHRWDVYWSSESPEYGGHGTPPLDTESGWHFPAHSCVLLRPVRDVNDAAPAARRGATEPA